ncbi:uncharacterized protein LOC123671137 isoform X2 [Harmonia axyridis]|uniref:uncharacterized protein LOC123671137 isoform X2 n=1 Tax=Harmonia axyridis TaxID=115357 RepID=UPI001E279C25|nr:uncharacterized protein LOC123671137 isoform X2 [Harmonia axyridis]
MGRYQYSGGSRCCVSNCSARNICKNEKTDTKIFSTRCNGKILKFCLKNLKDYQALKKEEVNSSNDSTNASYNVGEFQAQIKLSMKKSVDFDHNYYFQQNDLNKLQNLLNYVHHLEMKIEEHKMKHSTNSIQSSINDPHFLHRIQ